jgi:hypothetical protein
MTPNELSTMARSHQQNGEQRTAAALFFAAELLKAASAVLDARRVNGFAPDDRLNWLDEVVRGAPSEG